MTIDAPGQYDLPNDAYHGNAASGPSLSSSGARLLHEATPAAFFHQSYLNPGREPEDKSPRFDLGTAAHTALLEPSTFAERIVVVTGFDDWKKKEAQQQRDAAYAAGKLPLLQEQANRVFDMRGALLKQVGADIWSNGKAEQSFFAKDALTGVWRKARPDFIRDDLSVVVEYKTTSSAERGAFSRRIYDHGYHIQGAWNLDTIDGATGRLPDRYLLVAQEIEAPYLAAVYQLDHYAIEWGRIISRKSLNVFARCLKEGEWPGYEQGREIGIPEFAETQLQRRHEQGEFE